MNPKWLEIVKKIPTGQKTRVNCTCGDGNTAVLNNTVKGYSYFCFRCDAKAFEARGTLTLDELAAIKQQNKEAAKPLPIVLPEDFTQEIPIQGLLWLYKAGITDTVIRKYGIGYSQQWGRVVIPVYDGDKLVWFQARALNPKQKPKYLQPSADKSSVVFKSLTYHDSIDRVVVTEDMLSCIRVGKHTPAASILGTKISTEQANKLSTFKRITTWLDSDTAGRRGSYKIRKSLSLVTEVDDIVTEEDPKLLPDMRIKELLCI